MQDLYFGNRLKLCVIQCCYIKINIMMIIFVGIVNGFVMKEKDMNEVYMLLKNVIVLKNFLVQVIIEIVFVSSNYRSYRNFKVVIELY